MIKSQRLSIRLLCCAVCVLCCFLLAQPAAAAAPAQQTLTAKIHNRPSYDAVVIGRMENGTELTILEQNGAFYKIDCYDMTGYIAAEQVLQEADGKSYVNCKEESPDTELLEYTSHLEALLLRHSLLRLAQEQLGDPYVYGGKTPGGFDCSGLMYYLYAEHGFGLHRTASQQLQDGIIVAKEGMQVGDLVFFREYYETYPASHVGIYAGNNKIIHAGHNGISYADLDGSYYSEYFLCARRIVNTAAAAVEIDETFSRGITFFGITKSISGRHTG